MNNKLKDAIDNLLATIRKAEESEMTQDQANKLAEFIQSQSDSLDEEIFNLED